MNLIGKNEYTIAIQINPRGPVVEAFVVEPSASNPEAWPRQLLARIDTEKRMTLYDPDGGVMFVVSGPEDDPGIDGIMRVNEAWTGHRENNFVLSAMESIQHATAMLPGIAAKQQGAPTNITIH